MTGVAWNGSGWDITLENTNGDSVGVIQQEKNWQSISLKQCGINKLYARPLNESHVKEIANNFDERLFGKIIICDVRSENLDYEYEILDGNHRIHALKILQGENAEIILEPLQYMNLQSRADLYHRFNIQRKRLSSVDEFKASVVAGHKESNEIYKTCKSLGVNIKGIDPEAYPYVNSITDIRALHREGCLQKVLDVLIKAYKDTAYKERSLNREMLRAIKTIVNTYGKVVDYKRLISKLSEHPPKQLIPEIKFQAEHDGVHGATKIVDIYNKKAKKNKLSKTYLS